MTGVRAPSRPPPAKAVRNSGCRQGHRHESVRAARRCDALHLLERAGEISALEIRPHYWFHINGAPIVQLNGRRIGYRPEFRYRTRGGRIVCETARHAPRASDREAQGLRAALFRALYPETELREL